jgi:UDP-N-acetylmuramoyl-L-alanyl-D-glutamate--2,6-diaminopimelate ligase
MPTQEATGIERQHAMPLRELVARAVDLPDATLDLVPHDLPVQQVTDDSRRVRPGACFVAVRGTKHDGAAFTADAIARGAVAVVTDAATPDPAHVEANASPGDVVWLRVADPRRALARMAAVHQGLADLHWKRARHDIASIGAIGVTGTNGKSTVCCLARAILEHAGLPTALFGTIHYDLIGRCVEAPMTTPPATQLIGYMVEAARAGARYAVLETSSHALDQRRTDGLRFDAGVFTNLTGDHLDYHKTPEAYRLAKRRLFDLLDADAVAVINVDDPLGESMIEACAARIVRYGLLDNEAPTVPPAPADGRSAGLYGRILTRDASGTRFVMYTAADGRVGPIDFKLIGRHNVMNALAAAAAARYAAGVEWADVVAGLESVTSVRGRLENVGPASGGGVLFNLLVDYAHTDDALDRVLEALRPLAPRKLIVVFGCGGDRDRTKRPRMAAAAATWADRIIVTSDNPRTEDPAAIIADVLPGFPDPVRRDVIVEPDRAAAIAAAIGLAGCGDVVLLAGKGHETYQEINGRRIHFDDAETAAALLDAHAAGAPATQRTPNA